MKLAFIGMGNMAYADSQGRLWPVDSAIPLMCPLMTSIPCVWQRLPLKPASPPPFPLRKLPVGPICVLLAVLTPMRCEPGRCGRGTWAMPSAEQALC